MTQQEMIIQGRSTIGALVTALALGATCTEENRQKAIVDGRKWLAEFNREFLGKTD